MRRTFILLLVISACLCMTASNGFALTPFEVFEGSVLNQVVKRNKLIVGMEMKFFPFEYANEKGEPIGFDVEIAQLAAKELGVEIELKDMEFSGLIPALQGGKIDMIISGMTRTLTRAKAVSFTQPYFETGLCVLLNKEKAAAVQEAKELNAPGRVVAVKLGTTGDLVATRMLPNAQINRYKEETACVREVVTGRADAFFYDQLSIGKHHKENAGATRALLKPFTYEPFAIAIKKGDVDFLSWLNMFIETIKADGRYQELYQKHFHDILQ